MDHHPDHPHVQVNENNYIHLYVLLPLMIIVIIAVVYVVIRKSTRTIKANNVRVRPSMTISNISTVNNNLGISCNIPINPHRNSPPPPYQEENFRSPNGLPKPPPYTR